MSQIRQANALDLSGLETYDAVLLLGPLYHLLTARFTTLSLIGCEGIVAGHEEKVNVLQGEAWARWVDLNYRLGQEPSLHGAADHLLYVGRKTTR